VQIEQTEYFKSWLLDLRDPKGKASILRRIKRFENDNFGDVKPVGEGVSEARIDIGPGYRVYFVRTELVVVVLLCGGDKSTQQTDIDRAKAIAAELKENGAGS